MCARKTVVSFAKQTVQKCSLSLSNYRQSNMFSFTVFVYYFTVVSWVALATPHKPQQSLVSQSLLANQSTLDSYDAIQLRKLNYLGSSFFVYTKSLTTGDAIDYVVDGASGEKKIGNVFDKKTRHFHQI